MTPKTILIITTPKASIFYTDKRRHFAEYRKEALEYLFKKAGLKIVQYETHFLWSWWTFFRHPIKFFFLKTQIFILNDTSKNNSR